MRPSSPSALTGFAQVSRAFLKVGMSTALKYPLGFFTEQIRVLGPVVIYFFIAGFVEVDPADLGGDYFTYVMVGIIGMQTLNAGLRALSVQVDRAVSRGWFEMILTEPVPWRVLPYAMSQWPIVNAAAAAFIVAATSLILGAEIRLAGLPVALAISALGVIVGLAIGATASSVKVLAKRGDPVLTFYSLGAAVFAGVFFPVEQLPPVLKPLSYLFVHTYVIVGLRDALMPLATEGSGPNAAIAVLVLFAMALVLVPVAALVFGKAMEYGRKMGLLAGY